MVLSEDPLMSLLPTTTTACTMPSWPVKVCRALNVVGSHI